jgi:hypothetical protein
MAFVTIEHGADRKVAVNTDLIAYLRQDLYGTAIHFSSGEHIVTLLDLDELLRRLRGETAPLASATEALLIQPSNNGPPPGGGSAFFLQVDNPEMQAFTIHQRVSIATSAPLTPQPFPGAGYGSAKYTLDEIGTSESPQASSSEAD